MKPFSAFEKSTGIDSTKIGATLSKLTTSLNILKHNSVLESSKELNKEIKTIQKKIDTYNKAADALLKSFKGKRINASKLNDKEKFLVERLKEYADDMKVYKDNLKKRKNPEYEKSSKLASKAREASENYRTAISNWLTSKKKNPNSEETAKLGAEVGRLKKIANDTLAKSNDYDEKHKDLLPTGVPIRPIFGVHKNVIPKYLTQEEKDAYSKKATYTHVNRFKK